MKRLCCIGLALIFIYSIPYLAFFIQDEQVKHQIELDPEIRTVNEEVSAIPLIRNLHTQEEPENIEIQAMEEIKKIIKEELNQLYDAQIVTRKDIEVMESFMDAQEQSYIQHGLVYSVYLFQEAQSVGAIDIDIETKKMIRMIMPITEEIQNRQEYMYRFIQYLELDTINDWHYLDGAWLSQKANCMVQLNEPEEHTEGLDHQMFLEIIPYFQLHEHIIEETP